MHNAIEILPKQCGVGFDGIQADVLNKLDHLFQKRHPITHNIGVIDRKYLERIRTGEQEGKEVRVTRNEVLVATDTVFEVLENFHLHLFHDATEAQSGNGSV